MSELSCSEMWLTAKRSKVSSGGSSLKQVVDMRSWSPVCIRIDRGEAGSGRGSGWPSFLREGSRGYGRSVACMYRPQSFQGRAKESLSERESVCAVFFTLLSSMLRRKETQRYINVRYLCL
jgi:hypothetical protein